MHDHSHAAHEAGNHHNEGVVLAACLLTAAFMVVEVVGGFLSGSLALIADAGHMLTDTAALALAWAGFRLGRRSGGPLRSFGDRRLEVLAAFVNACVLILLVLWILWEAVLRLLHPSDVLPGPMLVVALLGLAVNGAVFWLLHRGDTDHVNIRGALLHVAGDMLGSVAAILAAGIIWATGWVAADPILSVLLSALILRSGWALLRSSFDILMEGAPPGAAPEQVRAHLRALAGVEDVHHLHIWQITSGQVAATLHLRTSGDARAAVRRVKRALAHDFGIAHSTVEIDWTPEPEPCAFGTAEG
ncbi:cation diffusion facilitator family transporter [Falsirhodobacter algicola]|uniref:Cation diffusion facilitator family transporter n=1 Tax=Falsirhodobacter algicola TaxID=2692330 RepID=A0A8J8SK73_9RHOB|nr:cation diffusion facilitator family transporter [Falsirhodobacter algicola]QUS35173.1 cation diffusion facilitator family transporter [Falsirhodobacter algicola]